MSANSRRCITTNPCLSNESALIPKKISGEYPPPSHYFEMVQEAIVTLKERTGSSQYAIQKFIEDKQKTLPSNFRKMFLVQLRKFAASDKLVKVKSSYKLPPARAPKTAAAPAKKAKPAPKAKTAAKPKAVAPAKAKAAPEKPKAEKKPAAKAARASTRSTPMKAVVTAAKKAPVSKKATPVKKAPAKSEKAKMAVRIT